MPALLLLAAASAAALAQGVPQSATKAVTAPPSSTATGPAAGETVGDRPALPPAPRRGTVLLLRGLDKITGRPTNITAPIGKPVHFATLTITARFCYSTPPARRRKPPPLCRSRITAPTSRRAAFSPAGCMAPVRA